MKVLHPNPETDHTLEVVSTNFWPATGRVRHAHHGAHGAPYISVCFAALLIVSIPSASADTLGRLFFTPEQRIHLDYDYARNAPTEGNSSPFFTVNGIVQKHGGPRTVWINGMSQNADNNGERNPTAQTVSVPGKSHPVKLKVGDKILLDQPATSTQDAAAE